MTTDESQMTEVEMAGAEQGIVVFDGSGTPLVLTHTMRQPEVADYLPEPVARRVLIARLRAWADLIERIDEAATDA